MTKENNLETEIQNKPINTDEQENPVEINEEEQENLSEEEQEIGDDQETEEEFEDTEYEGKKYKLPKEIKGALLRQADYTKKTQEISETRKNFEAQQQDLQKVSEIQRQEFAAYAEIYNLDQQLKEYENLDWNKLVDEDPNSALKIDLERRALLNHRAKRAQEIEHKVQEYSKKQRDLTAKHEEETKATLSRDIKNWGIEMESNLSEYAKANGIPESTMKQAVKSDAIAVKILHKAYLYDQLQKRALNRPKPLEAPAPIKPIKSVSGRASNAPSDKDSMNDWLAKRKAQLKK